MDSIITDLSELRKVSAVTTYEEITQLNLIERLRVANKTAWTDGAGLAAIQIGVDVRFGWGVYQGKEFVLLNPEVLDAWGEDTQKEGCLSIPDFYRDVTRNYTIEYVSGGKKRKKHKVSGFLARLVMHEIDHMDGVLIVDNEEGGGGESGV